MFCENCGSKLKKSDQYCSTCGTSISRENEVSNENEAYSLLEVFADNPYYIKKWKKSNLPSLFAGFNLSACILGFLWIVYRKMYFIFFIYFISLLGLQFIFIYYNISFYYLIPLVFHIVLGIFGNSIYYHFARNKTKKTKNQSENEEKLTKKLKQNGGVTYLFYSIHHPWSNSIKQLR